MLRELTVDTRRRAELVDLTARVARAAEELGAGDGVVTVWVPHTTAGVTVNEHADPDVARDILDALERMVPWEGPWAHEEGNAAAHVKASLMGSSVTVPVRGGKLALGTWQGIFLAEFDGPRTRRVIVSR